MKSNQKFAIPTLDQGLTAHFGHCEKFAIVDVKDNQVVNEEFVTPPVHQPGVYPKFLSGLGVNVIIAGGMGLKAQNLFAENNIEVCMGIEDGTPKKLVEDYLNNQLKTGQNFCDH